MNEPFRLFGTLRPSRLVYLLAALTFVAFPGIATANEQIVLFGQVTDESGAAIEGATVVARVERSIHQRAVDELAGEPHRVVAESSTNAKGTYFLRVAPGAYEVEATADGRAAQHIHLLPVAETFQLEPVALPPSDTFRVRVRGADGQPAFGAYVAAVSAGAREQSQWHGRTARVRTDETGAADLSVNRDGDVNLRVVAEDGTFFYRDGLEVASVDVHLETGTEWTVRVEDPQGNALSGVLVHLTTSRIPVAQTGDDGTFRLRLPETPPVTLRLTHADGRYLRSSVGDTVDDETGDDETGDDETGVDETRRHVFTLEDPVPVSGRVLDSLSLRGVAGAIVWPWGRPYDFALTDRSGGFQLPARAGSARFHAAAQGYGEGYDDLRRRTPLQAAQLQTTQPAAPKILLPPATRLMGRVVDPDGQGIARVDLVATVQRQPGQPWRDRRNRAGRTRSDEDGRFIFDRLFPESDYQLEATRAGFARTRQWAMTLRPPEVAEVELRMEPGIQAMGRVVDEADQPLAGATVDLYPPAPDPSSFGRNYHRQKPNVFSAISGENGEFLVADVARDSYRIEVQRPGYARTVVPGVELNDDLIFEVATESGEIRQEADLGVIVMVPGAQLDGVVVDADDRPIEGVEVLARPRSDIPIFRPRDRNQQNRQTTDAEGRFRFVDLTPDERLDLDVKHDEFAGTRLAGVQPPTDEPLRIVLERTATVRGRVVDESFSPVPEASVYVQFEGPGANRRWVASGPSHDQTDATGAFELKGVPSGSAVVAVGDDLWKVEESPKLKIEPGSMIDGVEVRVSRSILLTGSVRGAGGEPATLAQVSIDWTVGNQGRHSNSRSADSEGRFEMGGVAEGEVTVTASHPTLGQASKTVQVAAPGAHVDLVLEPGSEIAGQVVGPDDLPVAGAIVMLQTEIDSNSGMPAHYSSVSETADGSGNFRFTAVADGKYRLTADHPDFSQHQTEPFEVGGSMIEKRLQLGRGAVVTGRLEGLEFEQLGSTQVWAHSGKGMRRQGVVRHDATYRMTGLGEGLWYLQAKAGERTRNEQLMLQPGQAEASIDFDFSGGFDLAGHVLRDGEPVSEAHVMVNSFEDPGRHGQAQSDFDGRFRLGGLEEGRYTLQVYGQEGFRHVQPLDIPYPGDLEIHVRTSGAGGVVRSVDGTPLPGAQVIAQGAGDANSDDPAGLFARMADRRETTADSSGVYRFDQLTEGLWTLTASHDGFAQSETTVQLVQGGDLSGLDFALKPVQGLWLDLVAAPGMTLPPTVSVAVLTQTGEQHSVVQRQLDAAGAVHLSSLPAGTWRLAVMGHGSAIAYLTVQAPDDRPTVFLVPEANIQLTSADLDAVPGIYEAAVTRSDGLVHLPLFGGHMLPAWPLMPTRRVIQAVPPGTWTVEVALADGRVLRGTTTVASGETVELELSP